MTEKEEKLLELRERIPRAKCPDGCYLCCGSGVRVSHTEMCRIEPPPGVSIIGCAWLDAEGRCRVYGERPIRCRAFGVAGDTASEFHCPAGCRPERELTHDEVVAIITEYDKLTAAEVHIYTAQCQEAWRFQDEENGQDTTNDRGKTH